MLSGSARKQNECILAIHPVDGSDGRFGIAFEIGADVTSQDQIVADSSVWFDSREERDRSLHGLIPQIVRTFGAREFTYKQYRTPREIYLPENDD